MLACRQRAHSRASSSLSARHRRLLGASVGAALFAGLCGCGGGGGGAGSSGSSYTVGGTVSGLSGSGLVLEDNGGNALSVSGNGSFVFTTALSNGASYTVAVATEPSSPIQACSVTNGTGTISSSDVTSVTVSCGQSIASSGPNVATLTVDSGPPALPADDTDIDTSFVTVTICAPGSTTNCQSIDHVEVDTASYGLRIQASVLNASLYSALPQVNESSSGSPLAECTVFADGYTWGPIKTADVQISSESAASVEVQLIGDPDYPSATTPNDCTGTGGEEDTVDSFGANGIIGVGPFAQDCGEGCTSGVQSAWYYVCPSTSSCSDHTVSLAQQVTNPVVLLPTDNNGTIVELPAISAAGAATVSGVLVFGIGTEGNNDLGSATVLTADDTYGDVTTQFNGQTLTQGFLDTGSNGLFFSDSSITQCPGATPGQPAFYCPGSTLNFSATNIGLNDVSSTVSFSIANLDDLASSDFAFDDIGGTAAVANSFDWGLPFFFGRNVYTAIDGQNTSAGMGPYFAY